MADNHFQDRLTDDQRRRLDEAYKNHFGEDFRALAKDQAAELKQHAERADRALYPAPENPDRNEIATRGGLDPTLAKRAAVYRAWETGEMPPQIDDKTARRLDPTGESVTLKKFREDQLSEWKNKTAGRFDPLTNQALVNTAPKSKQVEIEPEEFVVAATPKAPKREGRAVPKSKASVVSDVDTRSPDELEAIFMNSIGQPIRKRNPRQS